MAKRGWITGKDIAALVVILVIIDGSCFGAWSWLVSQPAAEEILGPEAVRVGLAVDTTHYSGKDAVMGARLAIDEINEYGTGGPLNPNKGGVKVGDEMLKVKLLIEETGEMSGAGTERTISAVTRLIKKGANVVMGGYSTEETALETCCRYKTVYICTMSGEPRITQHYEGNPEKYKYVFSLTTNETLNSMMWDIFLRRMNSTYGLYKVAMINEEYEWVDEYIKTVNRLADEGVIQIVYEVRFPSTVTTFMPYLTKARDAGAQIIVSTIALDWGLTLIKEWSQMKYGLLVGHILAGARETAWEETGGAIKYFVVYGSLPPSNVTDWGIYLYDRVKEVYGKIPSYTFYNTYYAVYAFCRAVENAGTLETETVISALKNLHTDLPSGEFMFNSNQGPMGWPQQPFIFGQWRDSGYRPCVLANPDPYKGKTLKQADLVLPPDEDPSWVIPGYTP
jgi:ABC-type branched-subunit amino acid transport system substrate-binding protein